MRADARLCLVAAAAAVAVSMCLVPNPHPRLLAASTSDAALSVRAARAEVARLAAAARRVGGLQQLRNATPGSAGHAGALASVAAEVGEMRAEVRGLEAALQRLPSAPHQHADPAAAAAATAPAELLVAGTCDGATATYTLSGWIEAGTDGQPVPWYSCASGGAAPKHLYFDASCDGTPAAFPRWVLDDDAPARDGPLRVAARGVPGGFDWDQDGACVYRGRIRWPRPELPLGTHTWRLWCGEWKDAHVTVQAGENAARDLQPARGEVRWLTECVYEMRSVCAGEGGWYVLRPDAGPSASLKLRSCNDIGDAPVTAQIRSAPPGNAKWDHTTPLWVGHLGRTDHLAHWIKYTLVPIVVVIIDLFRGRRPRMLGVMAPGKSRALLELTKGLTFDGAPAAVVGDAAVGTVCHSYAAFGHPMQEVDATRRLAKHERWFSSVSAVRYFESARRRAWSAFNLPALAPRQPVPASGRANLVLTFRGSVYGVGRNLTNSETLAAVANTAGGWRASCVDWAVLPLQRQAALAQTTEVLMGVHGNNLAWQLVMPEGSVVVELCPFGCTTTMAGVNVGDRRNSSFSGLAYIARRLRHTFVGWQANTPNGSPLRAPPRNWPFAHRCKPRSSKSWMCRDLELPEEAFTGLLSVSRPFVGSYDGLSRWSLDGVRKEMGGGGVPCTPPWCVARPPVANVELDPE